MSCEKNKKKKKDVAHYDKPFGTQCAQWRPTRFIKVNPVDESRSYRVNLLKTQSEKDVIKKFREKIHNDEFALYPSVPEYRIESLKPPYDRLSCEVERILKLLHRTMEKIKIVGRVGELLFDDGALLKQLLNENDSKYVLDQLRDFEWTKKEFRRNLTTIQGGITINTFVVKAFKLLIENHQVYAYIKGTSGIVTPFCANLAKYMGKFIKQMERELTRTAKDRNENYKEYARCVKNIKYHVEDLKRNKAEFAEGLISHKTRMSNLDQQIAVVQMKIRAAKKEHADKIETLKQDSEEILTRNQYAFENRTSEVEETGKYLRDTYQQSMAQHLLIETKMQDHKKRLELKLDNWIGRYDKEMSRCHEKVQEISEEYEADQLELVELQCLIKEQEGKYARYKYEKAEEDRAAFDDKVLIIRKKIAARAIQRFWRNYRAKKRAKRLKMLAARKARQAKKKF